MGVPAHKLSENLRIGSKLAPPHKNKTLKISEQFGWCWLSWSISGFSESLEKNWCLYYKSNQLCHWFVFSGPRQSGFWLQSFYCALWSGCSSPVLLSLLCHTLSSAYCEAEATHWSDSYRNYAQDLRLWSGNRSYLPWTHPGRVWRWIRPDLGWLILVASLVGAGIRYEIHLWAGRWEYFMEGLPEGARTLPQGAQHFSADQI